MRFNLKPLIAAGAFLMTVCGPVNAESYLFYQAVKGVSPSAAPGAGAQPKPTPPEAPIVETQPEPAPPAGECRYEPKNTNRWIEIYSEAQEKNGVGYGLTVYWDGRAVYSNAPTTRAVPRLEFIERNGYRYYPGEYQSSSVHSYEKKTYWHYSSICRTPI